MVQQVDEMPQNQQVEDRPVDSLLPCSNDLQIMSGQVSHADSFPQTLHGPNLLAFTGLSGLPRENPNSYHINTRLRDGRPSIIVDPGSVGNLAGDRWCKEVAKEANKHGHMPRYERRARSLSVSGVGNGSQECHYDCELPVALHNVNRGDVSVGTITTPSIGGSDLPGLLGLQALRKNRAVLDMSTFKVYFLGPGDYDLMQAMPPGTDCYQGEEAPSGHLVLPICEFNRTEPRGRTIPEHTLTLVSKPSQNLASSSSSSNTAVPQHPPPQHPPRLPAELAYASGTYQ